MTRKELLELMSQADQLCDSRPAVIDSYESLLQEFQVIADDGKEDYMKPVDCGDNVTILQSYIKHYKTLLYVLFAYTEISRIVERKAQSELLGWLEKHKASTENLFLTFKDDKEWN